MQVEQHLHPFTATDPSGRTALVVAPHPDDESIGCGGALALHRRAGDRVCVVTLTDGAHKDDGTRCADYAARRRREALAAAELLGVARSVFLDHPDRRLRLDDALVEQLSALLREEQPDIVYAPSPVDLHPDHKTAAHAVWAAARAVVHPCELYFYELSCPFRPNVLVDISPVIEEKSRAIRCYASQLAVRDYLGPALGLNRYRALTLAGATHAEAYWRVRAPDQLGGSPATILASLAQLDGASQARREVDVAVVVRTRDRHSLLREALLSLTLQTHLPEQVILVDTGEQSAAEVAREFSDALPLQTLRAPGALRSAAGNLGWRAASSSHVLFLDDDDLLEADHLERLCAAAALEEAQLVYTGYQLVELAPTPHGSLQEVSRRKLEPRFEPVRIPFENPLAFMGVLIPVALLEQCQGLDEQLEGFEDWDLWIRLADRRFTAVPGTSAIYRVISARGVGLTQVQPPRSWWVALFEKHRAKIPGEAWADWSYRAGLQSRRLTAQQDQIAALQRRVQELEARLAEFTGAPGASIVRGLGRISRRLGERL